MRLLIAILNRSRNTIQHSILAKRASINGLVSAIAFFVTLLLNLFLARWMGTDHFGIYTVVFNWVVVLSLVGRLGADQALLRLVAAYRVEGRLSALKGILIWSRRFVLAVSMLVAVVTACIVYLLQNDLDFRLVQTFWLGCLLIPLAALNQTFGFSLRGLHHFVHAVIPERVAMPMIIAACGLVLYLFNGKVDSVAIMIVTVVAAIVALGLLVWLLRSKVPDGTLEVEPEFFQKKWIQMSIPMVFVSGALVLLVNTDILMVGMVAGTTEAGIYSVSSRLAGIVAFGLFSFNTVVGPMISELYSLGQIDKLQSLVSRVAVWIGVTVFPMVLVMLFMGEWLLGMFGHAFTAGYVALVILCIGQMVSAGCGSSGYLLTMTGNHLLAAKILSFSALFNIIGNAVLIPLFGIAGAAVSTAASTALWNILMVYFVRRRLSIQSGILSAMIRRYF